MTRKEPVSWGWQVGFTSNCIDRTVQCVQDVARQHDGPRPIPMQLEVRHEARACSDAWIRRLKKVESDGWNPHRVRYEQVKTGISVCLDNKAGTTELPVGDSPVKFLEWLDVRKDAVLGELVLPDVRGFILCGAVVNENLGSEEHHPFSRG